MNKFKKNIALIPDENTPDQRSRAVRAAASRATNAEDLHEILSALGLNPAEGKHTEEATEQAAA